MKEVHVSGFYHHKKGDLKINFSYPLWYLPVYFFINLYFFNYTLHESTGFIPSVQSVAKTHDSSQKMHLMVSFRKPVPLHM